MLRSVDGQCNRAGCVGGWIQADGEVYPCGVCSDVRLPGRGNERPTAPAALSRHHREIGFAGLAKARDALEAAAGLTRHPADRATLAERATARVMRLQS